MARSKPVAVADVMVVGSHAASYVAAAVLAQQTLNVLHVDVASESSAVDRLARVNPELFKLHELLTPLRRRGASTPLYGLTLLPPKDPCTTRHTARGAVALAMSTHLLQRELADVAEKQGATLGRAAVIEAVSADETGVHLTLDGKPASARMLILADVIPVAARTVLHVDPAFDPGAMHRVTWISCKTIKLLRPITRPALVMSLDLAGKLLQGFFIPGDGEFRLGVAQPVETQKTVNPTDLLRQWIELLVADGVLRSPPPFRPNQLRGITLPFGGALGGESVANRTLLIGPAGGFVSSTGEDVYPGCWSAVIAADVAKKALRETHLQDALNPFRQKWRITMGEYLRGPQLNLGHLLPLVYRNEVMNTRLAEAILEGKSVVR